MISYIQHIYFTPNYYYGDLLWFLEGPSQKSDASQVRRLTSPMLISPTAHKSDGSQVRRLTSPTPHKSDAHKSDAHNFDARKSDGYVT